MSAEDSVIELFRAYRDRREAALEAWQKAYDHMVALNVLLGAVEGKRAASPPDPDGYCMLLHALDEEGAVYSAGVVRMDAPDYPGQEDLGGRCERAWRAHQEAVLAKHQANRDYEYLMAGELARRRLEIESQL
jgi:hypothetical protein